MANKPIGSIVATVISTGLKIVFHVYKDGGAIRFTRPDMPNWSHVCHESNEADSEGWVKEVRTLASPMFANAVYHPA